VAGLIGSAIGSKLLGEWGPILGGVPILPALIGSIILILLVSLMAKIVHN
ncbi:Transglycosylase associated family protein, partial [human gut metagenome]